MNNFILSYTERQALIYILKSISSEIMYLELDDATKYSNVSKGLIELTETLANKDQFLTAAQVSHLLSFL